MCSKLVDYKNIAKKFIPKSMRSGLIENAIKGNIKEIAEGKRPLKDFPLGVNIFGNLGGFTGLAEASRGLKNGIEDAGMNLSVWDYESDTLSEAPYLINMIHANPNMLIWIVPRYPAEQWKNHYNIGFWDWEQEILPKQWIETMPAFDEFWTSTEFSADAIRRETDKPVIVVPHIINAETDGALSRKDYGLPEDVFLFLVAFDTKSNVERKNPYGAIKAFKKAFTPEDNTGLVLKIRNLDSKLENEIREDLKGYKNIYFLSEDYSRIKTNTLTKLVDVYLSLHRSEGFGLVLAEAMYMGTPVVATNWSGNVDFMNNETGCMVDAKMLTLDKNYYPYLKGSRWADPDLDQAARYMKKLYEDETFRKGISDKAGVFIREKLSEERVSGIIADRLNEIKNELGK